MTTNKQNYNNNMQLLETYMQMVVKEPQLRNLESHSRKISIQRERTVKAEDEYQKSVAEVNKYVL